MSLSITNATAAAAVPSLQKTQAAQATAKAPDGDYKYAGAGRVKDTDGDYVSSSVMNAKKATAALQEALTNLVPGGK